MTKLRPPLSFEAALLRIAERIGWPEVVRITGKSDRAVRNWSDPDTSAGINLAAALVLDVAFHAAGGEGAPLLQVYQTRLGLAAADAVADRARLSLQVAKAAHCEGRAIEAAIIAAQPGSTDNQLALAEAAIEETIAADEATLAAVHSLRRPRAPEVAPPSSIGPGAG